MEVAARPDVAQVTANHQIQLQEPFKGEDGGQVAAVESNITFVKAPQVWAMGYTGENTVMAGNDTGLYWNHPALIRQYRGCQDPPTCSNVDHNYNWWDATDTYPSVPNDGHGHGTHTSGTMVGEDAGLTNQIGMAPGARLVHCKNMNNSGSGSEATFTECFQWDLAPWNLSGTDPRPDLAPDAINNSWGHWGGGYNYYRDEIAALHAAGILVEVSAGNEGSSCSSLRTPGDYREVLTTGSVNHANAFPGTMTGFSSRGPSDLDGNYFPDITAPGENIRSSVPGGGYEGGWSGTSMAGPHATALVGLLWSACPAFRGQVEETIHIITSTAAPVTSYVGSCGGNYVTGPNNDWGYGTIDALAAVNEILALCGEQGALDGHTYDAVTAAPLAGATVTAKWESGGQWQVTTDAGGYYTRTLPTGTYTVTGAMFGYAPETVTGVEVITAQVTTQDLYLDPLPTYVVSGTVSEAGTGLPLYAKVEALGTPLAPVWTDPGTGFYAIAVPEGTYTFHVSADLHQPESRVVVVGNNQQQDYALFPLPCILLVDDDNNSPDTRPYFTAALDTLGYDYDIFDVGGAGGNGPTAAQMAGYSIVIWFSGDKWGSTSAGPNSTDEGHLVTYLNGGGRLFLSSQDYLYDMGLTTFGQNYLGIGSYTNDSGGATSIVGLAGDPIGGGLGPFNLTYPTGFSDYGDIVDVGVAPASQAFRANNNSNNLDVDKDGGAWKTVFFGTDWVPLYNNNAANGRLVLDRIITWFGGCQACEAPSDATFDWTPLTPFAGEAVTFTASASGTTPMLFAWNFGDGGTGVGPSVVHTYAAEGDYTVHLTVTNACGTDHASAVVTVQPALCDPVEIVTVTTEISGCAVTFGAEFTGTAPYDWTWDFGPLGTSTETHPVVDFGASGSYPYTLTVANACGNDIWTGEVSVECAPPCDPVEVVTVTTEISGCAVTFGAEFTGTAPYDWTWDFGPLGTSTETHPVVDFGASGSYPYTLTVANACGNDIWTGEVSVECAPPCDPVEVVTVTTEISGCAVTFGAEFTGTAPYDWTWDFGPLGTSTETHPVVDFGASGSYPYTLTVANACGNDIWTGEVSVECAPPCVEVQIVTYTTGIAGCVVTFSAELTGTAPFSYLWDFGPLGTSTEAQPVVNFGATGTYSVTLDVTNCTAGHDRVEFSVSVTCAPATYYYIYLPVVYKAAAP